VVLPALEDQIRRERPTEFDGRFVRLVEGIDGGGLAARDLAVLRRITGVHTLNAILETRIEAASVRRLQDRGVVQLSGVTPSDAAHVLGQLGSWNGLAAMRALELLARRRTGSGQRLAPDAAAMARMIVDQLTEQTCLALLETAFSEEGSAFSNPPEVLARHELLRQALKGHRGLLRLDAALNLPVVGLGASAPAYYPAVGQALKCEMILPEHAGVANAIGAVVGRVTIRKSGSVTSPSEGLFRTHGEDGPRDFGAAETAMRALEAALRDIAEREARESGAVDLLVEARREVRHSAVEGRDVFIEAMITVEASGRPRIAVG